MSVRRLTSRRCLCLSCGEVFNSTYAQDKHRTGSFDPVPPSYGRRCLTPAEMTAKGFAKNAAGWWVATPRSPFEGQFRWKTETLQ